MACDGSEATRVVDSCWENLAASLFGGIQVQISQEFSVTWHYYEKKWATFVIKFEFLMNFYVLNCVFLFLGTECDLAEMKE